MHTFRDFFVPTEENQMTPVLLSREAFVLYLVLALGLAFTPAIHRFAELASLANPASFGAREVIALVNQSRSAVQMGALTESARLDAAAAEKIEDMLAKQYFAHTAPDGKTPWDFVRAAGYYPYLAAGENLARDFVSAEDAHAALMQSPTHRANIVSPLYTEIGVAVGQGTFEGRTSILIAEHFGKPRPAAAAQPAPPAPAPVPAPEPVMAGVRGLETREEPGALAAVLTPQIKVKTVAILVLLSLLLPLGFVATRFGTASIGMIVRTLALLAVFAYVAAAGMPAYSVSRLTPVSASILTIYDGGN